MDLTRRRLVFAVVACLAATCFDSCSEAFPQPSDVLIRDLGFNSTSDEIRNETDVDFDFVKALKPATVVEEKVEGLKEGTTQKPDTTLAPANITLKRSARSCPCKPGCSCSCPCHRQQFKDIRRIPCPSVDDKFEKSLQASVSAFKKSVTAGADALGVVFKKLCSLPQKMKCDFPLSPRPPPPPPPFPPAQMYRDDVVYEKHFKTVLVPEIRKKVVRRPVPVPPPRKNMFQLDCKDNFDVMKHQTVDFFTHFFGQIGVLCKCVDGIFDKLKKDVTPVCAQYEVCEKRMETSKSIFEMVIGELLALLEYGPKFLDVLIDNDVDKGRCIVVPEIPVTAEPSKQIVNSMKQLESMIGGMIGLTKDWIGLFNFDGDGRDKFDDKIFDKDFFPVAEDAKFVNNDFIKQLMDLSGKLEFGGNYEKPSVDDSFDKLDTFDGLLEILKNLPMMIVEQLTGMTDAIASLESKSSKFYNPMESMKRGGELTSFLAGTASLFGAGKCNNDAARCELYSALVQSRKIHVDKSIIDAVLCPNSVDPGQTVLIIMPNGVQLAGFVFRDEGPVELMEYDGIKGPHPTGQIVRLDLQDIGDCDFIGKRKFF